jgi:type IV secretion system protein TrbL
MSKKNLLFLAGLMLVAAPAFAAGPGYDLGGIMTTYKNAATQFGSQLAAVALKLSFALFTIDLAWTILSRVIKGSDTVEMGTVVVMRVMWMGMVLWVMKNADVPLSVVNSFIQLGKEGANTSAISPSDVFWQGIDLVNLMMTKFSEAATLGGVPVPAGVAAMANPFAAFLIGGSLIVIIVVFAMLAAQFAVAYIQLWFFMAVYPIVLAFGVTNWTKDIAMKILTTPLVYGVRFMAVYFVIGVGTEVAGTFGQEIAKLSISDLSPIWAVLAGAVLLLILAMQIPAMASDLLSGTASLSAAQGVGAVVAGGGALAAAAGGLYAAGSAASGGIGAAIQAGANALGKMGGGGSGGDAGASPAVTGLGGGSPAAATAGLGGGMPAPSVPGMASSLQAPGAPGAASAGLPAPASPAPSAAPVQPPAPQTGSLPGSAGPAAPAAPAGVPDSEQPGQRVTPAAPMTPAIEGAAPAAGGSISAPAAPESSTAAGGSISAPNAPAGSPEVPQPRAPGALASQSAQAAQRVLDEMAKSNAGGGGIQIQHGHD